MVTPAIASAIERPLHRSVCRPFGGGRRKSLSRRFADILKGRTAIVYDPQDLTTLFQDAAGTLPVYRPGTGLIDPPVGLMLDKSGGGYHASQPTTTARPTLSGRYNLLTATETLSTQSVTTVATNYTLRFEGEGTVTLTGTATGTYSAGTHTITCTAGTLTCTVAGVVTRADLRVKRDGSSLPAYQSVTNANTYDTAGFPLFLKRDKVDDDLICQVPTGGITGAWAHGTIDGPMFGTVAIPAGEYHPFGTELTYGLPDCTQWIAIDGTLSASEQAVFERYVYSKARQLIDVDQFGATVSVENWFRGRTDITNLRTDNMDVSSVASFASWVSGSSITRLDTSNFSFKNNVNLYGFASGLRYLQSIDLSGFNSLSGAKYLYNFLYTQALNTALTEVDLSPLANIQITDANAFLWRHAGLSSIDISMLDFSQCTRCVGFASECKNLSTVLVGNAFDNTPCTNFAIAFTFTNLNQASIDAILVSINTAGTSNGTFGQSGGSAPSATGEAAITAMRSRGWTVTVTGGF